MYSPNIDPEQIKKLYLLKMSYAALRIKKPMTEMIKEALDDYLPKAEKQIISSGGVILKPDELEAKK
ncbi:MAG: hypothetical protein WC731_05915 [Candidatus Omnitrophota bacterium]|jgi:hypothetical protein